MGGITDIKNDPTGRRTLLVAFVTLLATILVPCVQHYFDVEADAKREAIASKQHDTDVMRIQQLQQQLVDERNEATTLEKDLIKALGARRSDKR